MRVNRPTVVSPVDPMTVQMMTVQMTVTGGFHRFGGFTIGHPTTDLVEVEAPYAPDFESGQAAAFQQTINCDPVDVKMLGQFGDSQNFFCHGFVPLAKI